MFIMLIKLYRTYMYRTFFYRFNPLKGVTYLLTPYINQANEISIENKYISKQ